MYISNATGLSEIVDLRFPNLFGYAEQLKKMGADVKAVDGGAPFSEKHPGFIINLGEATYEEVNHLITLAQERVNKMFGLDLEVEWKKF